MSRSSLLLPFLVAAIACSGEQATPTGTTVGATGGTIVSDDGKAELVVPPGALDHEVSIRLTKVTPALPPGSDILPGTTYRVDGNGAVLAHPAELRIRLPPSLASARAPRAPSNGEFPTDPGDLIVCNAGDQPFSPGHQPIACYYVGHTCPAQYPVQYSYNPDFHWWHYQGPAVGCGVPQISSPQICPVDDFGCLLSHVNDSGQLAGVVNSLGGTLGIAKDVTPPAVSLVPTPHPAGASSTLTLDAVASDNHEVVRVVFLRIDSATPDSDGTTDYDATAVADLDAPPWTWTSAPTPAASLFGRAYAVIAYDGAGNIGTDIVAVAQPAPEVVFSATPSVLPVPGSTTLTWSVGGADSVSIDHGVGAVAASGSTVVNVNATTTFTLTAVSGSGTTTGQATVTVGSATDIYVDAVNGDDTHAGTSSAPVKRLTKAATLLTPGASMVLLDGTWTKTLEGCGGFPCQIILPDAVTVRALHARAATLEGVTLRLNNTSASVLDLRLSGTVDGGIIVVGTTAGRTLSLNGVQFAGRAALFASGSPHVTMVPGSLTSSYLDAWGPGGFASLANTSVLTITGGTLDANGSGIPSYGGGLFVLTGGAGVVLDGVTVKNWKAAGIAANLIAPGAESGITLRNGTIFDHVGGTGFPESSGAIVVTGGAPVLLDGATITGAPRAGVVVRFGANLDLTLQNASITETGAVNTAGFGIYNEDASAVIHLTVVNSNISQNQTGIYLLGAGSMSLTDSHVDGNTHNGIDLRQSVGTYPVTLRNTSVKANGELGLYIHGGGSSWAIDLGTAAQPGSNIFQNVGPGLKLDPPTPVTVQAHGNSWLAGLQGADANGHYASANVTGPVTTNAKNYVLVNASTLSF